MSSKGDEDNLKKEFYYSTEFDFEKLLSASKAILKISENKNKIIGKVLGSKVKEKVDELESFLARPFMNVRKPIEFDAKASRLACIHLLAMCTFIQTPSDRDQEISSILSIVIKKVNFLLRLNQTQYETKFELFSDLKRITAHVISSKNNSTRIAEEIAQDDFLPCDYRISIITSNKNLFNSHKDKLVQLFEDFSFVLNYVGQKDKYFSECINLLDLCTAYSWKYKDQKSSEEIIRIWEKNCSNYDEHYVEYARKLYSALSNDNKEIIWLKNLNGFQESYCLRFLEK